MLAFNVALGLFVIHTALQLYATEGAIFTSMLWWATAIILGMGYQAARKAEKLRRGGCYNRGMAKPNPGPLDIVQVGTPVLRQEARSLTLDELASPRIQQLIADMRDTMRNAPGVGLAAPQIGESIQLVVIEDPPAYHAKLAAEELAAREREAVPFHVLVNPVLTIRTDETVAAFEGCLSFAGFHMIVPRARKVRVEALDEHGNKVVKVATGWYARILQHEVDHLHGIVCCDRMESRTLTNTPNFERYWAGKSAEDVRAAVARAELSPA